MAANQVDFKILPSDQFSVYSPQTRSDKVITYFTLLSKLRGDILSVGQDDDPNDIVSAFYSSVGGTQTLHLVKADGSEITASNSFAGTVTSIGVSMPSAFTVTNSPITTSGTIQVTGAGTTLEYVRGDGTLATFPALTGFVPYTGATQNVDLGEFQIKAGQVSFDLTPTGTAGVGIMRWNSQDGTVDLGLMGGNVTLQIGQEQVARVVNKSLVNLTEAGYQAVKITGAQGNRLKIGLAQANNDANSADTLGLVTENISVNQEGFITSSGLVRNIDTTGALQGETWIDGNVIYLSPTTAGAVTNIKPTAPDHTVIIGFVVRAHQTQGEIYVKVDNGYELEELHDVAPTPYVNNGVLYRNTTTNLWKSATIPTILGYTPANAAITISTTAPLSGGGDLSANRTLSISQAGASTDGYLSSTDWTTFNSKQGTITLTTTGTTGAATLIGATLNIPNYADQFVGTVTSVDLTASTGISVSGGPITSSGSITVTNTAPDQVVSLTGGTGITTSGTYPSFTVTNSDRGSSQNIFKNIAVAGQSTIIADDNDDTLTVVAGSGVTITTNSTTDTITISATGSGGSVTSVATTAPITGGTITTTGTIGITQSGAAADGYLSSTDWNTFNNKQNALTNPVTGTGTTNYVSKFTSSSAIGNSQIFDDGTSVGIGTAVPGQKLQVDGNIYVNDDGTTGNGIMLRGADRPLIARGWDPFTSGNKTGVGRWGIYMEAAELFIGAPGTDYSNALITLGGWLVNGTRQPNLTLNNSTQRVGIGNTAPSEKLHVTGNIRVTGAYYDSGNSSGTSGQILSSTATGTSWIAAPSGGGITGSGTTNYVTKWTSGSAVGNSVMYDDGTNVGINTTTPTLNTSGRVLHINAPSNQASIIHFTNATTGALASDGLIVGRWDDGINYLFTYENEPLYFGTNSSIRMVIASAGNVLMNTTVDPTVGGFTNTTLSVKQVADGLFGGGLHIEEAATTSIAYFGFNGSTFRIGTSYRTTGDYRPISFATSGLERLRIANDGNVGIGTTGPTQKLDVDGNIMVLGLKNTNDYFEKILGDVSFANGDANKAFNIILGNSGVWGYIEVEVNSTYNNQSSAGKLTKRFAIGTSPGNLIYVNESRVSDAMGTIVDNIAIGNFAWDGAISSYVIPISHIVSTGNAYNVRVRCYSQGVGASTVFAALSLSAVYTFTALARQYPYYNDRLGIGTTSPTVKLQVSGGDGIINNAFIGEVPTYTSANAQFSHTSRSGAGEYSFLSANDGTTFINSKTGTNIRFRVNNNDKVIIDSAGNVGIGNTGPTQILHVTGNIRVTGAYYDSGNSAGTSGQILSSTATGTSWIAAPSGGGITGSGTTNYVPKFTGASAIGNSAIYDNAGNVGIGTTAPTNKLHIDSTDDNAYALRVQGNTNNALGVWTGIGIAGEGSNTKTAIIFEDIGVSYSRGKMHFALNNAADQTNATPANAVMTLTPDGTVGIGTTSPGSYKLSVAGGQFGTLLKGGDLGTGSDVVRMIKSDNSVAMLVRGDGNVGINTTSPLSLFHIKGNATDNVGLALFENASSGGIYFPAATFTNNNGDHSYGIVAGFKTGSASGTDRPSILFYSDLAAHSWAVGQVTSGWGNNDAFGIGYRASNDPNSFGTWPSNYFTILTSGNVGINTTAPSYRLDVSGDARITSGSLGVGVAPNATDGRIDASNDIVAFSSSDLRLKENIKPIENALDKVKSLTGVEFDWKPELKHAHGYEGHDTGVIAQEVQEVMPTAIRTNDTGYLAVRYEKLIGLLIEANKELATRVEQLESKLK